MLKLTSYHLEIHKLKQFKQKQSESVGLHDSPSHRVLWQLALEQLVMVSWSDEWQVILH